MKTEEFYIGWQGTSPPGISKHVLRTIICFLLLVIVVGFVVSRNQKKFGTGSFEFGKLTELTGNFSYQPVPSLRVAAGSDLIGNQATVTIPLIGFGKFGAEGVMKTLEKQTGQEFESMKLTLKGTLLYNDGKLLMQIDANDQPLVGAIKPSTMDINTGGVDLGEVSIKGEIVDPKCYFGVMKPGIGKPHKDCAIRCILGGIPPVLRVATATNETNYYLVVGPNGEPMNTKLKDFVAEPVCVKARAVKHNDWIVLYTSERLLTRLSKREFYTNNEQIVACAPH
jgi:hypothetical protein